MRVKDMIHNMYEIDFLKVIQQDHTFMTNEYLGELNNKHCKLQQKVESLNQVKSLSDI